MPILQSKVRNLYSYNGDVMLANNHVTGGPAEPEVEYEVLRDEKEILFTWPHPFTWKDYPITGYHIVCREMKSEKIIHDMTITDTEGSVVNHTVTLPPYITDCHVLQCIVNATNSLGQSPPSISNISLPRSEYISVAMCGGGITETSEEAFGAQLA